MSSETYLLDREYMRLAERAQARTATLYDLQLLTELQTALRDRKTAWFRGGQP